MSSISSINESLGVNFFKFTDWNMCLDRSCSILECNLQYSSKETSFTLLEPISANMDAGTLTEFVAGLYNEYYVFLSIGKCPKVSDALRSYMSSIWERVLCSSSTDCTC